MSDIRRFLAHYPPFDQLDEIELARVVASTTVQAIPARENVLVEDGPPSHGLFVIRTGSMELVHEDETVDILEPGESFGHPSLLTGLAPAFTVRAREDSTCYVVGRDAALEILGRPTGARYVAATIRERLVRTGHTVHALPELRTTRVHSLIPGPPVFCDPADSIRDAARAMTEHEASAVLIRTGRGLGIVTESDLRKKVVAGGISPDSPVSTIMSLPVRSTPADRYAGEAILDMLQDGIHHLPVLDSAGAVLGVISAADLMGLEARGPFALRRLLAHARDEQSLFAAAARMPETFVALLEAGIAITDVGKVLTLQNDTVTSKLLELAFDRFGPPPAAWAWLALGSAARRELTMASDQDNALAYAPVENPEEVDAYFGQVADYVNAGLATCGFGLDVSDVMARNPAWRMSAPSWVRVFRECLEHPDRSNLVRAAVAFDFRHVGGGLEIVAPLVGVLREVRDHPDFIARLARTATDQRPPLGFRGHFRLDGRGDDGVLDLKKGGASPVASLARFHALANGVTISSTVDRLQAVEQLQALPGETAAALHEAFIIVMRVRLEHHAAQIRAGLTPDNLIHPSHLTPLARSGLREAFRVVATAQKQLNRYVRPGL